jgi:predicted DNA-binding protein (UPF0278 family)
MIRATLDTTIIVVTQDKDLLALGEYQGVRMVEPPEFYQILRALEAERTNKEEPTFLL